MMLNHRIQAEIRAKEVEEGFLTPPNVPKANIDAFYQAITDFNKSQN